MSGVITTLKRVLQTYGRAAVPALLLHALLLAALLQVRFTPAVKPADVEPVVSYLYQQPVSTQQAQPAADTMPEPAPVTPDAEPGAAKPSSRSLHTADSKKVEQAAPQPLSEAATSPVSQPAPQSGLARRSLERAATTTPAAMDQAAAASYQQFLQAQQPAKITVEKRHQQLSKDPAQQVVAKLADGRQIIRTRGGCRIADPAKDGFDALMALKTVPCGDEDNSSDLLRQALEKHSKR